MAREIQLTDWSTAGNLSNRSSGVQIPRDICTRFGRYLYSTKCSWIIRVNICIFVFVYLHTFLLYFNKRGHLQYSAIALLVVSSFLFNN